MISGGLAELQRELLAARDRREEVLREVLARESRARAGGAASATASSGPRTTNRPMRGAAAAPEAGAFLFVSTNVPGPGKCPPGLSGMFDDSCRDLLEVLPSAGTAAASRILVRDRDILGPYVIAYFRQNAALCKRRAVAWEERAPGGRLMDVDVYDPGGWRIGRDGLALKPRPCLVCDQPARECMLLRRHEPEDLVRACEILIEETRRG